MRVRVPRSGPCATRRFGILASSDPFPRGLALAVLEGELPPGKLALAGDVLLFERRVVAEALEAHHLQRTPLPHLWSDSSLLQDWTQGTQ